jgi:hypothetical protein
MAIAIDASSPIRFTGTPANNVDITSASFTPPTGSVLVVCVSADTNGSGDNITISVSGSSLTWTNRVEHDPGDASAMGGHASIWTPADGSTVPASSQTVSVRRTAGNGSTGRISVKIYVVTGADTADPTGATGENHSTTNNITPNAYTSTVNNSRAFGCATDWNQLGVPTSTDTEDGADYSGAISVVSLFKAADTATSGTTVTMNFDAGGTGNAEWNWVALEVRPGAGGASQDVTASAIASAEAFGTASVNLSVAPSGIASAEAFGTATLTPGAVAVSPSAIASAEAFGTASVNLTIAPAGIASAEAFGTASINLSVSPSGIASAEAFGSQTLQPGAVTVTPSGIAGAEAFGSHTVSTGTLAITASGIASAEAFGSHALTAGAVTISVSGIASGEAFGSHIVSAGGSLITPNGIASAEAFGSHTLTTGAVSIQASGIATAEAFGSQSLGLNIAPAGIASGEAFGTPALNFTITAQGIGSAEAFGSASVNLMLAFLMPSSIASGEAFGAPAVTGGGTPAALFIDNRSINVSWIDNRTVAGGWIDDRTIDLE